MKTKAVVLCMAMTAFSTIMFAQEREDRTLYNWAQMQTIVNEASGERAMHHVLDLAPYPELRTHDEYEKQFRESGTIARIAREDGFSDVEVESFPGGPPLWQASQGELWMVQPKMRKLYDIHDVLISAVASSESGDVTAELVDVGGGGREEDYKEKDVAGKIVLGSAPAETLQQFAIFEHGAVGVISYQSHRPDTYPGEVLLQKTFSDHIPPGKEGGFAWAISPRAARELISRLEAGEKVVLRSVIKADTFAPRLETVHAVIPGDGSSDQAIMISSHIYEGYLKQGANDNASGSAATLEIGRTLIHLIAEGKLPRPKRTIHFTWMSEITGTTAWLARHDDVRKHLIADINFDQVGLNLRKSSSVLYLYRTPDTVPSFVNDVCASFLEFVAKTNRERLRYRYTSGYAFSLPVLAPTGSIDPFYAAVENHANPSDHRVYLDNGIPAVLFNDWPDMWYHSSEDTPEQGILDATELKRVVVVGAASASILASADDKMAARVLAESVARGSERMGEAQRKGMEYLASAHSTLLTDWGLNEARNTVQHQAAVEKSVIQSVGVLFADPASAQKEIASFDLALNTETGVLQTEITEFYRFRAAQLKVSPGTPTFTEAEKSASASIVEPVEGENDVLALLKLPADRRAEVAKALTQLPLDMQPEFNMLLREHKSVLEIRDFLSAEFEPLQLSNLLEYLRAREELGSVRIVSRDVPKTGTAVDPR